MPLTFDESIDIIDEEIIKRRAKWTLSSIQWMDYNDVSQILRIHISKKWHLWDQARPIRPWLHAIISNQIKNLIRNSYGNFSRPCLTCSAAEEGNLCNLFVTQCNSCPFYAHWEKTKKRAHDIKLPLSLDFHANELSERPEDFLNLERASNNLHQRMKETLKPIEYKVYKYLYMENREEGQIGKLLGFKTNEKGRQAGYRTLKTIKDIIFFKAKAAVYNNQVDF